MIDELLQIVAPHHCSGCGKTGTLLCQNCKYDIISDPFSLCIACGIVLTGQSGICGGCRVPYSRAWCVGARQEALEHLIDTYKFANARSAFKSLAELLDTHLPELPDTVRIVPIPTVASHIRQRGYDHMALIATQFARQRGVGVDPVLSRVTNTRQRSASRRERNKQAKAAFVCTTQLDKNTPYLLIDDVVTTGATLKYAAKALRDQGAQTVWVASISRQTLD